jgi:predicted hotdog family 3-hydroxylacyl-ACP dehydratase
MKPADFRIQDLIPQRPPMVMIDRLTYAGEKSAKGSLFITESNIFCENQYFLESGIIEFMAQTAAAYTGYKNKCNNIAVSEGYIGAVKNLAIHSLPPKNAEIQSEIIVDNEIAGFTIISGKVLYNSYSIAECEIRIFGK